MDHRPSANEVEEIEHTAKQQEKNEHQASEAVQEIMQTSLPQRSHKSKRDQPNIYE
jgi:hypothetical protein